ncbi:MAG: universal stress protein, partial [Candidatus Limnocylindrales bacterium]
VGVAADQGEGGEEAGRAAQSAAEHGAVLLVLAVARTHHDRVRLEAGIGVIADRARAAGVTATTLVWHGNPAEAIVQAAWTERADIVVLGSRRRRNLRRMLLGSVSSHVANEAACRVVIVPSS